MSITADQKAGGRPGGQPPTAVQCALAVVTAGLAVAAAMLALIGTAQAGNVGAPPEQESYLQDSDSLIYDVRGVLSWPGLAAGASCEPLPSGSYSGSLRLEGEAATDGLTLTASIDGRAWGTAIISGGRYAMDIPEDAPAKSTCFPGSGTIVFSLDGYSCMPAEEDGTGRVACGYRSFTPGDHDVDLVCLAAPTSDPELSPEDVTTAAAPPIDQSNGLLDAIERYGHLWQVAPSEPPAASAPAASAPAPRTDQANGLLDAIVKYRPLWQAQSDSSSARAAFVSGLIPYQAGDAKAAKTAWEGMLNAFPGPEERAQAHLWLAKAELALTGDSEAASAHLRQAQEAAPGSFYALRAEAWLAGQGAAPTRRAGDAVQVPAAPDWEAVEGWLTSLAGPEALVADLSPFDMEAWQRGQEFHWSGLEREATSEFLWVMDQCSAHPWSLYRLARTFDDLGMTHLAARAATRLLAKANASPEQAPRALVELAYPYAYPSFIDTVAAENDLSPLLLLALIRQESFFNPLAGSSAGALGLTQVMPSTGQGIAAELNVEGFSPQDLLQPEVSVRFGAHYLGSQLDTFGGNVYFALAAYNAGPDSVRRWSQNLPTSDVGLFVELIEFAETRSYVKLVLENYAVYRFLYDGADHPTLVSIPSS
jgi:soluble lytic murein transglycosylase-like protein